MVIIIGTEVELMKKNVIFAILAVVVFVIIAIFSVPKINTRTWQLVFAHKQDPYITVAHKAGMELSDASFYGASQEIDLILEARKGKITITDNTNNKTYTGSYRRSNRRSNLFRKDSYSVIIEGVEGTANISSNSTMFVSIGDYYLDFAVK